MDGTKRHDDYVPQSMFNIVPSADSKGFTPNERKELEQLFNLKTSTSEDEEMSHFEDDMVEAGITTKGIDPLHQMMQEEVKTLVRIHQANSLKRPSHLNYVHNPGVEPKDI